MKAVKNIGAFIGGRLSLHLMILPGVVIMFIFCYIPMYGNIMAFEDFNPGKGFFGSPLVGLKYFIYLFRLPNIGSVLGNTLTISFTKMLFGTLVSILVALMLNEVRSNFYRRTLQTMIYLPYFLSWVILGSIFIGMLTDDGIVNLLIERFGGKAVFFLGDNHWFRFIIIATDVWKNFGFGTIVYLAAITTIDPELYQAAIVDGAGYLRRTWHITLPGITPIIVLMSVLSLGNLLNAGFDQIFIMYNNLVMESSDIIDTLVYRLGIQSARYSLATAVGFFKSAVSLILISASYWAAYRFANYRIF